MPARRRPMIACQVLRADTKPTIRRREEMRAGKSHLERSGHKAPQKQSQGTQPLRSSMVRASHITPASSRADRLVSQTARVHQNITLGSSAHAHADMTATFSENIRFAIRKMGMHVSAEKTLLITSSTKAEAFE